MQTPVSASGSGDFGYTPAQSAAASHVPSPARPVSRPPAPAPEPAPSLAPVGGADVGGAWGDVMLDQDRKDLKVSDLSVHVAEARVTVPPATRPLADRAPPTMAATFKVTQC